MTHALKRFYFSVFKVIRQNVPSHELIKRSMLLILVIMLPLGYFESFRWPYPPPKATHGILKGLFLILSVLYLGLRRSSRRKTKDPVLNIILVLYIVSALFSTIFSQSVHTSILNLWYVFIVVFVYLAFEYIKLERKDFLKVKFISIALLIITFSFALFSLIFRHSVENVYYFIFLPHRANHLLSEIREVGKYVGLGPYFMLVPICSLFLVSENQTWTRRALAIICLGVAALTAIISNNRIDVLVFFLQMLIIFPLISRRLAVFLLILIIPFSMFGMHVSNEYFEFNIADRIFNPTQERDINTIYSRFSYWREAVYNFASFPILGTGLNTFNDISSLPLQRHYRYGPRAYYLQPAKAIGVHNIFLERLSDTGLFGFLTFTSILVMFFRKDLISLISKTRTQRKKYVFWSLASWSYVLYGITDNGFGVQGLFMFFYIRGLMTHL